MRSIVYLIGAGPGAPDLITLRGYHCLQQADVVIYDHRVHADVLQYAPAQAERIDVHIQVRGRLDLFAQSVKFCHACMHACVVLAHARDRSMALQLGLSCRIARATSMAQLIPPPLHVCVATVPTSVLPR